MLAFCLFIDEGSFAIGSAAAVAIMLCLLPFAFRCASFKSQEAGFEAGVKHCNRRWIGAAERGEAMDFGDVCYWVRRDPTLCPPRNDDSRRTQELQIRR